MYNFEEIKKVLEPYRNRIDGGVFNCFGSDSPDQFTTVYKKDGITILHNTNYNYMDVVGLSEEHLGEIVDMISFDWAEYYEQKEAEASEYEFINEASVINNTISIMTSYFSGDIDEDGLVDMLMSMSNNNKYVKEYILNIITDQE